MELFVWGILGFCLFFILLIVIIVLGGLNRKAEEEASIPPQPSGRESLTADGVTVENVIVTDSGIRIAGGPFIITDSEGNLITSWDNSREWTCKGFRIYSRFFPSLTLTIDTTNSLYTVYLDSYLENNSTQRFYNDGTNIKFFTTEANTTYILQGLGVMKNGTNHGATFTTSGVTLDNTILLAGVSYPLNNLTNASFMPDDIIITSFYSIGLGSDPEYYWNSGIRRISNSLGGVLALNSLGGESTEVIYMKNENNNVRQNAVVINNNVYFLGDDPAFCYLLLEDLVAFKIRTAYLVEETESFTDRINII